ncbi:4606_t:CDS:2 [Entrophospora sp. SA101]|nr:4606_t:CDS:2 [Entrophospora sp. SA101]
MDITVDGGGGVGRDDETVRIESGEGNGMLIAQESAERKAKMVAQDQAKSNKLNQSK